MSSMSFDLNKPDGWDNLSSQEKDYAINKAFEAAWKRAVDTYTEQSLVASERPSNNIAKGMIHTATLM